MELFIFVFSARDTFRRVFISSGGEDDAFFDINFRQIGEQKNALVKAGSQQSVSQLGQHWQANVNGESGVAQKQSVP